MNNKLITINYNVEAKYSLINLTVKYTHAYCVGTVLFSCPVSCVEK